MSQKICIFRFILLTLQRFSKVTPIKPIYTILLALLLGTFSTWAAPHQFRHLEEKDGIGDGLVNCFHADHDGNIWLGTGKTLDCFDGRYIVHYTLPGNEGLTRRVTAIQGNRSDEIWVGNGNGLYLLKKNKNELQPIQDDRIDAVIDMLDDGEFLLVLTPTRLLYTPHNSKKHKFSELQVQPINAQAPYNFRHIAYSKAGILFISTETGLVAAARRPDPQLPQVTFYHYTELPQGGFTSIATTDSLVFLGSAHDGVYRFNTHTGQFAHYIDRFEPISALQITGDTLWVGTDGTGIFAHSIRHDSLLLHISKNTGNPAMRLANNSVYALLRDPIGLLWVGYYQQGLSYTLYQSDRIGIHQTPMLNSEGLAVRALAIHEQQRLIGTREGLYFIDKAKEQMRYYGERELHAQMVFATTFHHGTYYVGTYGGGLLTLDPETGNIAKIHDRRIGRDIFCLASGPDSLLYVGSENGIACLLGSDVVCTYGPENMLPEGRVYCIYFETPNRAWIGTEKGVAIFTPSTHTFTQDLPTSFPKEHSLRAVYRDSRNLLYFLPDKGNIFVTDTTLQPIHSDLPDIVGLSIVEDKQHSLWITTEQGLYRITASGDIERFGVVDGLPGDVFTLCQAAIDDEGTLWFGNASGLIWAHPDSIAARVIPEHAPAFAFSTALTAPPSPMSKRPWLKYILALVVVVIISLLSGGLFVRQDRKRKAAQLAEEEAAKRAEAEEAARYAAEHPEPKYKAVNVKSEEMEALRQRLQDYVETEKVYLNPDLKIGDLAGGMQVQSYMLSYLFNQYMKTTFYDYMNHYRALAFMQLIRTPEANKFTMDALANKCGFSSRASFFRNFKKETGLTPAEWLKQAKQ